MAVQLARSETTKAGYQGACDLIRRTSLHGQWAEQAGPGGLPVFAGEFWTAGQRKGHSLHEVSYRACFKPQLPEYFIERLTKPGDVVFDPFMGRGTTLIQAALMGRRPAGNDINPLSVMLARPRVNPPSLAAIEQRLGQIPWDSAADLDEELLTFYHSDTLAEISGLRAYLIERDSSGELDAVDDWIRMVAINRLTGHSSGFFSVYSMPPNQAVSVAAQRKINAKRNQTPPRRDVAAIILKKSKTLMKDAPPRDMPEGRYFVGAANDVAGLADASVDLVVTSPPFLDVVQYAADNWLRCWFAGLDASVIDISMHSKPAQWTAFVYGVLIELGRVVKSGGHVAFEVGEVRNGRVRLEEQVLEAMAGTPFDAECLMINQQVFTKTANCWGIDNNAKGTNSNRIVLMRRR